MASWQPPDRAGTVYEEAARWRRLGRAGVLATVVETGAKTLLEPATAKDLEEDVEVVLRDGRPRLVPDTAEGTVFLEPLAPEPLLVVLGGGHVGLAAARLARSLGYRITVVDDRASFAEPDRFGPGIQSICAPFGEFLDRAPEGDLCHYLVVTRGHAGDRACVEALLGKDVAYLGMIGSRRKVEVTHRRLVEAGVPPERLARLTAPVGLDLGGRTPEEIALAVMAEICALRYGRIRDGRVRQLSREEGS